MIQIGSFLLSIFRCERKLVSRHVHSEDLHDRFHRHLKRVFSRVSRPVVHCFHRVNGGAIFAIVALFTIIANAIAVELMVSDEGPLAGLPRAGEQIAGGKSSA